MSSLTPQAGKHRASKARRAPKAALKTSLTLSSMAVVATGFAVGTGSLSLSAEGGDTPVTTANATDPGAATADMGAPAAGGPTDVATGTAEADDAPETEVSAAGPERARDVTRSDSRAKTDPSKRDTLALGGSGNAMTRTEDLSDEDPRDIARALLAQYGWDASQFSCLDSLWQRESGWNPFADNPSSSAYGIPQALPGSKMSSAGEDWATNPVTQIKWGLGYIEDRYGSPCSAWGHSESNGWY